MHEGVAVSPGGADPSTTTGTNQDPEVARVAPATIYDVAKLAGVSHQTVSRQLKGFAGIRPETRLKVEKAIEELGYRPNLTARNLKSGRSHRIGALTHAIDQTGPNQILRGAAIAARQAGYVLDIVTFDMDDPRAIREGLEIAMHPDLAGILVLASTDEMIAAFRAAKFQIPVHLSVDASDAHEELVSPEVALAVQHVYDLGHRNVFHIAGPANSPAARHRRTTFENQSKDRGMTVTGIATGDWSSASGFLAMNSLPDETTAVIAANDQMALGALLALDRKGRRVPEDVSVVGIDDTPESAFYSPPLTTVHVDFVAQGSAALKHLLHAIDLTSAAPSTQPRTCWLVERESSRPPARTAAAPAAAPPSTATAS